MTGTLPTLPGHPTVDQEREKLRSALDGYAAVDIGNMLEALSPGASANRRKAERLRRAYDELEARIARLAEAEELAAIRPDLDGNQIMQILGIGPGREVGRAYKHLLELRMEQGPMPYEDAKAALLRWWAEAEHPS